MKDRVLTPVRSLARDLIDKRLWPIAIVLLVALVAVPVLIGSSASDVPPPAPVVPVAPAGAKADTAAAISVVDAAVIGRSRPGAVNDPFYNPPKPKLTATSSSAASSAANTQTSASTATTSPAPTSTPSPEVVSPPQTTHTTTPTPKPTTPPGDTSAGRVVYRTKLSFGPDENAEVRVASRLEPLGGKEDPSLLYLGTTGDGSHAVFLLAPNAVAVGEGVCGEPTCRVIALKPGEATLVALQGADGQVHTSLLKIVDVARRVMDGPAAAAKLRRSVHPDGRDVLRAMIKDAKTAAAIGQFGFDRTRGAVVAISAP